MSNRKLDAEAAACDAAEIIIIIFLSFTTELIVLWQKATEVVVELSNIVKTQKSVWQT